MVSVVFFFTGLNWINKIQTKYMMTLNSFAKTASFQMTEKHEFKDQLFVLKQILKFKILLFLFFFSQVYDCVKAGFFYALNIDEPTGIQLRLYGMVS